MTSTVRTAIGILVVSLAIATCHGQVLGGAPAFNSLAGGPDVVNLGNLNVHWDFPIINKAGRGQNFTYDLTYDNSIWYPVTTGSTKEWATVAGYGWGNFIQTMTTYIGYSESTSQGQCGQYGQYSWQSWTYDNFYYRDPSGVAHPFGGDIAYISSPGSQDQCPANGVQETLPLTFPATDGSGLSITVTSAGENTISLTGTTASGTSLDVPVTDDPGGSNQAAYTTVDHNGNEITYNGSGQFTDTLGTTPLTISGNAPANTTMTFTNPSGGSSQWTIIYAQYNLQTNFGCYQINESSASGVYLPTTITLPDDRTYQFTYEATPGHPGYVTGRIATVTLPTGALFTYSYTGTNNGIECSDGSAAGLTRTTPGGEWQYSRSGSGSQWTTTITAPTYQSVQSQTVIAFLTDALPAYANFYEISRKSYTGTATGTPLQTILTCYNSADCSSASGDTETSVADPISWLQRTTQMGGSGATAYGYLETYDGLGEVTSHIDHAYGSNGSFGAVMRQILTAYSYIDAGHSSEGPSQVTIEDGSGTIYSEAKLAYDQTAVNTTSGTPQHASNINFGNLTTLTQCLSSACSGATALTSKYTYYDTGNVDVATDVNGAYATYTYGNCGNSFPTEVSYSVNSLTTQATWNCSGGVVTQSEDANQDPTTYNYADPNYWRATSITDWLGNTTTLTYPTGTGSNNFSESAMLFNGNQSTSDLLTAFDSTGRLQFSQVRQGPSSTTFDTTETTYDSLGRVGSVSIPYSAAQGVPPSPFKGVSYSYDPLGRYSTISDSGGATSTYTWTQNDELIALGPAPSGENLKQRQYEYDPLGRLGSVCEVTSSLPGKGTCNQVTSRNGYWTEYTYDAASRLTKIQQNAQNSTQTQNRAFSYDWLGRMTSQTIPESGTTSYTYDSAPACPTPNSFPGDLVMIQDQLSNVTCNQYDGLHRLTSTNVISGTYSGASPAGTYVYDAATTPGGIVMQNVKGQLAKACTGSCASPSTMTFFSYSPESGKTGRLVAQQYQRTPHSGGVLYLVQDTYYPNGALGSVTASYSGSSIPGMPTVNYGVDGEGRPYSASDSTNNLVTGVTYNSAELPTQVTIGNQATGASSDIDSFQYDSNTYRPTQFKYAVNPTSNPFTVTGNLTWNANWSLGQLALTDINDSSKNQTCTYSADDLQRISGADCVNESTTVWDQTFTYDPFGNITKSANPGQKYGAQYGSPYNNQVTGGVTATYDANGNQTTNTSYSFAWNAYGQPVTLNGITASYDALGRMDDTALSTTYHDFIYEPSGNRLAELHGTSLTQAWLPLPGGGTAMYKSSGLNYIRHMDWLGSSRLATTWTHGIYAKEAYAPFGEPYNETSTTDRSFTGDDQTTVQGTSNAQGLYDFLFRRHDPAAGRWLSPDPYNGSYDLRNPQSLNRYTYVLNMPLTYMDSVGLEWQYDPIDGCYDYWDSETGTDYGCMEDYSDGDGGGGGGGGGDNGGDGAGGGGAPNNGPQQPQQPKPPGPPQPPKAPHLVSPTICKAWKFDAQAFGVVSIGGALTGQEYLPFFAGTGSGVYWVFYWAFCT